MLTRLRLPEDPTEQLALLRDWRHDTAQMPRIEVYEADGTPVTSLADAPATNDQATEEEVAIGSPRRRKRPTLMVGAGLIAAALVLSGLAATGVGPVRNLLGTTTPARSAGSPHGTATTGQSPDSGAARPDPAGVRLRRRPTLPCALVGDQP